MQEFINKFKIPTLLGLGIIFLGLVSGVYLVLREQTFLSQAAPNFTPQNITVANIAEDSVAISWQTNSPAASFLTFGQNSPTGQTVLDDRDGNPPAGGPKPRSIHYVTLKNLLPQTNYQFKITSGKITSDTQKFETATPLTSQTGFTPVIGSILDGNIPLENGVIYLILPEATIQSSTVKTGGNFLIPLSQVRKADLSSTYQLTEGAIAKLIIRSDKEETTVTFKLKANSTPLPPIKLGQNIDLTMLEETPEQAETFNQYDLNEDGITNTTDYTTLLQNLGQNPKNKKADINGDGIVDQKDLSLMSQKLKALNSQ
ncbi:fibronectin type III domain-containing protein [Candidatus Daviesbacteria bacterium]|nr:fibronectin type III domain-containing protein [Candidatus Daviesbacteria bacterium]